MASQNGMVIGFRKPRISPRAKPCRPVNLVSTFTEDESDLEKNIPQAQADQRHGGNYSKIVRDNRVSIQINMKLNCNPCIYKLHHTSRQRQKNGSSMFLQNRKLHHGNIDGSRWNGTNIAYEESNKEGLNDHLKRKKLVVLLMGPPFSVALTKSPISSTSLFVFGANIC